VADLPLPRRSEIGSILLHRSSHPFPKSIRAVSGKECARICPSTGDVSGIIGGGFETVSFPFRKSLIQKTEENRGAVRKVRTKLHKIGQDYYARFLGEGFRVKKILYRLWWEDEGQDIAEYAVMLAVILVIVVGTIRLIGSSANNVFSSVASAIQ